MSRTANVNPLLVLLSLLVGTSIGDWVGGFFGSFVGALLAIPAAGALRSLPGNYGEPPRGRNSASQITRASVTFTRTRSQRGLR